MSAVASPPSTYTLVTFAPVQGFISASRKLRDLYGSSLLLSYLARAILSDAQQKLNDPTCVVSPELVNTSRGTPNLLVIQGDYRRGHGQQALLTAWGQVLDACRDWLEREISPSSPYDWASGWQQARLHSWEYFHAQGPTIRAARERMRLVKQARDWQAINWTGESSSLSGAEAVVRPGMGKVIDPRDLSTSELDRDARSFAMALRGHHQLGEAFIPNNEQLSLPELVKRLVTYKPVAERAFQGETFSNLGPENFKDLADAGRVVWFMADGDSVGGYLQTLSQQSGGDEVQALRRFSQAMRRWAASLYATVPSDMQGKATVIYAGGDDLLGALHDLPGPSPADPPEQPLHSADLWHWLQHFPQTIWPAHQQSGLTVSMGLVWCQGGIPQREALAQVRLAEKAAKRAGRNRFALRLLFRNGQHLEWICPWELLPRLREAYRDREQRQGDLALWRHLSDDLEWLAGRRSLQPANALALWQAYFGDRLTPPDRHPEGQPVAAATIHQPLAEWMQAMARVMASLSSSRANDPLVRSPR